MGNNWSKESFAIHKISQLQTEQTQRIRSSSKYCRNSNAKLSTEWKTDANHLPQNGFPVYYLCHWCDTLNHCIYLWESCFKMAALPQQWCSHLACLKFMMASLRKMAKIEIKHCNMNTGRIPTNNEIEIQCNIGKFSFLMRFNSVLSIFFKPLEKLHDVIALKSSNFLMKSNSRTVSEA